MALHTNGKNSEPDLDVRRDQVLWKTSTTPFRLGQPMCCPDGTRSMTNMNGNGLTNGNRLPILWEHPNVSYVRAIGGSNPFE